MKACDWCGGDCTDYVMFYQGHVYCSADHFKYDRKATNPFAFGELTDQEMRTRDMNKKPTVKEPVEVVEEEFYIDDSQAEEGDEEDGI